jgi:hypothetical protein
MAIWPIIFVKSKDVLLGTHILNHERIHFRQQVELLWAPFFVWYLVEFFIRLIQYRNWNKAYRNISFEREAYAMESNTGYLKKRRFWAFVKYL